MPELPEVQTIVNDLNKAVIGASIDDAWCDWEKMIVEPKLWKEFKERVIGQKIDSIERKGKFIVFHLDKYDLIVHLRMTGHFLLIDENKRKNKNDPIYEKVNNYIHFSLKLSDEREVALSDLRKFGKIYLTPQPLSSSTTLRGEGGFIEIGIDPFDKDFSFGKFKELLSGKKGNIKQLLMDQSLIAGIGNIYSSEILWEAGISPLRKTESLSGEELELIYKSIGKILKEAIRARGDSESDYRDLDGCEGGYQEIQKVYQRSSQKCYRCGGIIKRVKIGQRSGFYCSGCQK